MLKPHSTAASKILRVSTLLVAISITLGGCATGQVGLEKSDLIAPLAPAPIVIVSSQEEQMLRDATERAQQLHTQLRALEARNVTIVRRLPATTHPSVLANDKRLALSRSSKGKNTGAAAIAGKFVGPEQAVVVTERLEPQIKFAVEFAAGSATLKEFDRLELAKNLGVTNPTVFKIGGGVNTRIVVELSTHKRQGLDTLNSARMKSIVDALIEAGVPAQAIHTKTKRVESRAADSAQGSASRMVRITKLNVPAIRS